MSKFVESVVAVVLIVVGYYYDQPWLVRIGVAMLIDEAATSLIGTPSPPSNNRPGNRIIENNPIADSQLIYGSMGHVGGPPSYWNISGTNNEFLWYVLPISCRPIDGYSLLHIDSDTIDLATDLDVNGNVNTGKYSGFIQVVYHTGAIPATADATLVATFGAEYTASFEGNAIAYFWVKLKRDTRTDDEIKNAAAPQNVRLFQSGPPGEVSVSITGHRIYDPRQDSTNGGSGAQRANDPTTWVWSNNPALCIRDYLTATGVYKSHYANANLNIGCLDWPSSIIDDVAVATSANICDVTFTDPETITHAQYALDGLLSTGTAYGDNVQLMLTTMGGSLIPAGGKFQINAAQYVSPSFDIDQTWFAGKITLRTSMPITPNDRYNAIRGNFTDGEQAYQRVPFYPFTNAAYETQDGGRIWKDIDLSLVSNRYVAQRVAVLYGKMSRNQAVVILQCNLKALDIAIGDTVTLTVPGVYTAKVFKVYNWKMSPDGIELQLREEDSTPYSITTGELVSAPEAVTPGLTYPTPPAPTLVSAAGSGDGNLITVIPPPDALYKWMVVYRNTVNNQTTASYLGRFEGSVFKDGTTVAKQTYYYWIAAVNEANQKSSWLATGGVVAKSTTDTSNLPNAVGTTASFNCTAAGWYQVAISDNSKFADYRCGFACTVEVVNGSFHGSCEFRVTNDSTGAGASLTLVHGSQGTIFLEARVRTDGSNHTCLDIYCGWTSGTVEVDITVNPITGNWNAASATAGTSAAAGTVIQTLNMDPGSTGSHAGGTGHVGLGNKWHLLTTEGDVYHGGIYAFAGSANKFLHPVMSTEVQTAVEPGTARVLNLYGKSAATVKSQSDTWLDNRQTGLINVAASGWFTVVTAVGGQGRGSYEIELANDGGAVTPFRLLIHVHVDWAYNASLQIVAGSGASDIIQALALCEDVSGNVNLFAYGGYSGSVWSFKTRMKYNPDATSATITAATPAGPYSTNAVTSPPDTCLAYLDTTTQPVLAASTDLYTQMYHQTKTGAKGIHQVQSTNGTTGYQLVTIDSPGGATYIDRVSTVTGAICVTLPTLASTTMLSFDIDIFNYATGKKIRVHVSGYTYTTGWFNTTAHIIGDVSQAYTVRFGRTATHNTVWIGELTTQWAYPQVRVVNFHGGYNCTVGDWADGWFINIISTAFDTIDSTIAYTLPSGATELSGSQHQIGGPKNGRPAFIAGFSAAASANPVTASCGAASCHLNVNAHTLYYSNVDSESISAVSSFATGLSANTQYFAYTVDSSFSGGTLTWHATTSAATAQANSDGPVYAVTTPALNTSGGAGSGSGCLDTESKLPDGRRAGDLKKGDFVQDADGNWHEIIADPEIRELPALLIVAKNGCSGIVSNSTPFTLHDEGYEGDNEWSPLMLNHLVRTPHGLSPVAEILGIGLRPMIHLNLGGHSICAGLIEDLWIESHNTYKP